MYTFACFRVFMFMYSSVFVLVIHASSNSCTCMFMCVLVSCNSRYSCSCFIHVSCLMFVVQFVWLFALFSHLVHPHIHVHLALLTSGLQRPKLVWFTSGLFGLLIILYTHIYAMSITNLKNFHTTHKHT